MPVIVHVGIGEFPSPFAPEHHMALHRQRGRFNCQPYRHLGEGAITERVVCNDLDFIDFSSVAHDRHFIHPVYDRVGDRSPLDSRRGEPKRHHHRQTCASGDRLLEMIDGFHIPAWSGLVCEKTGYEIGLDIHLHSRDGIPVNQCEESLHLSG